MAAAMAGKWEEDMAAIRDMVAPWEIAMATETLGMAPEVALVVEVGVSGDSQMLADQGVGLARGGLNLQRASSFWAGWTMPLPRRACTSIARSGK